MNKKLMAALLFGAGWSLSAAAAPVIWTDWLSAGTNTVTGELVIGDTTVDVTYSGSYAFAQTAGGTNYWTEGTPAPYTGSPLVDNAPASTDIIALRVGGTKTITFSQPVLDPLIALVSWNRNTVSFSTPIEFLSHGAGHWGSGTPINITDFGFSGSGELHGVIRLPGTHSSFSFTDATESWHGFTIGVAGLADEGGSPVSAVPEPGSLALLGLAGAGLAALRRRKSA
ncbi:PEP-CTERM sorting domain-containing protein [Thauera phenolivorans]|uniref:PEP-CTERM sorting domain-containing protein n=1 Tax=Thauera phenolivorans TaxID=1792543 RepID=UPI00083A3D8B|nr:PEP-CTERM sorting domain-containing protein [Thauera phenolivorans]